MNFLQLLARRLGQAFAVLRDPDAGMLAPLPEPVVDPQVNADRLRQAAHEQGRADGERSLFDGWSFGREEDLADGFYEPEYVEGLRRQCAAAINEHRHRQRLTDARMADLHLTVRGAERGMRDARDRMARIAVRDQLGEEDSLRAYLHRRNLNADAVALPPLHDPVWEGEAPPMRPVWRVLLVCFLFAVVFAIEHYVAAAYLPATRPGRVTGLVVTAAIAGLTLLGPLVAGVLFRHRHATGSDRVLAALTFVLLLPALAIVLGLGLLAARLFDRGVAAGDNLAAAAAGSQSAALGLTPGTVVVVFDVALLLAGAMVYILGLAQPHPFQQAFTRNRRLRDRNIQLTQRMGTRINPDYRASTDGATEEPAADREQAITNAYLAAENAYYQGLIEGFADPTFTEAVMRRRNRQAAPAAVPAPGPADLEQTDA